MDCKALRIGNRVNCTYNDKTFEILWDNVRYMVRDHSVYSGIKITKAHLQEYGFVRKDIIDKINGNVEHKWHYYTRMIDDVTYIATPIKDRSKHYYITTEGGEMDNITFIHEFQNLHYAFKRKEVQSIAGNKQNNSILQEAISEDGQRRLH